MLTFAKFTTILSMVLCGVCVGSMILHATSPGPHGSFSWDSILSALSSFGAMAWALPQLVATLGIVGRRDAGHWRIITALTLVCLVGFGLATYWVSEQ